MQSFSLRLSIRYPFVEDFAYSTEERLPFLFPGVCKVDLLALARDSNQVVTMGVRILHLLCEISSIPWFKEDQRLFVEVILNAWRAGCNDRLPGRQIFEDSCGCIDVSERISLIRNNADVAPINFTDEILEATRSEIMNDVLHALGFDRFHDALQQRSDWTVHPQF